MSFIDRVFVGKVIRDFGTLTESNAGLGKLKISMLLAERGGRRKLIFKTTVWGFLAASVSYMEVPVDAIPTLQSWLGEAQALASSSGALPEGPYRIA